MKYFTKSGTEYELDEKNHAIRNGEPFSHTYLGVSDYYKTREILLANPDGIFETFTGPHRIYQFYKEDKFEINPCSFEDAKDLIDGKSNLVFINENLEEILMSTPIVDFQNS
jgi:hypothetical protein|tara:strand:- start:9744 stop:10079 length:336 start_codon:yes stop_codon:yes gene_type:complete